MSARIPPTFAEYALKFVVTGDSEPMFSFLGLDLAVGVGGDQTLTDLIDSTATISLDDVLTNDVTIGQGWVTYGQDGGDVRIDSAAATQVGDGTGDCFPPNVSVMVKKITASGGRRGRGRMFIPGLDRTGATVAGILNSGTVTAWDAAFNSLQTNLVALAQVDQLVLFHETAPFTPTPITDLVTDIRLATQRRRLRP